MSGPPVSGLGFVGSRLLLVELAVSAVSGDSLTNNVVYGQITISEALKS